MHLVLVSIKNIAQVPVCNLDQNLESVFQAKMIFKMLQKFKFPFMRI